MPSAPALPPYAVPCPQPNGNGVRYALVAEDGRLVRAPKCCAVGAFYPDGRGGFVAPAADAEGRWGYLDHRGCWLAEPALCHAEPFGEGGLSPFQAQDGRWGYAGTDGAPVIPATLVHAAAFRYGLAVAHTKDGAGFIDGNGRTVISGPYAAAGAFGPNGLAGVRVADSGLCGYVDRTGRTVIEPRFDGARPFGPGGAAPVRVGAEWGLIDAAGEWIVPPSHPLMNAFDDNGLAYVLGGTVGDRFRGFMNALGEVVIRADNQISDTFGYGLVRFDDDYKHGYLDATGGEVIGQDYDWAEDFDPSGAAVAHHLDLDDDLPGFGERPPGRSWGVLRADGRFTPVHHLEPVTDDEGWILGFGRANGLAAFVTRDGAVAHVDRDGRDVCRLEPSADGSVLRVLDRAGTTQWQATAAPGTFGPVEPTHCREARSYFVHPGVPERDIADLADELIAAGPRRFEPRTAIFGDQDPYDLSGAEDEDPDLDGTSLGAISVLAEVFLQAEHQHELPFLQEWADDRFSEIEETAVDRLTARFGEPLPGFETYLGTGDGSKSTLWQVGERHLVLQSCVLVGDGDVEMAVWLAVVDPSDTSTRAEA